VEKKTVLKGFAIVVLDRGFVYVGTTTIEGNCCVICCVIENARNIRVWGTTRGLGELALNGPTSKTKLDLVGTVRAHVQAVLHTIDTEEERWK
jgi:hypothetical protein